jgi:ABC-2 type transport system permease protein
MRKIWVVIRREFVEKVRNKWFIVSTVLGPILMAAFLIVPILLAERGGRSRSVAVVDVGAGVFGERLTRALDELTLVDATRLETTPERMAGVEDSLARAVGAKAVDGFLIVSAQTVEDGRAEYRGANVSSPADMRNLERTLREAVLVERLSEAGIEPDLVRRAQIPVLLKTVSIRGGRVTDESGEAAFLLAYIVWFVLYIAIILYGVQIMGSVVEEKTSRIIEVLVSSLRPFQLLAGKVLGVGAVGLFQFLIWGVSARVLLSQRGTLMRLAGIEGAGGTGFSFPDVSIATLLIVGAYFLLGYFLYAAMFAGVAAMSNSEAEARQAQTPVVMLLVIPSILMLSILQQPDGGIAVALSLIPFCSPIAMPVRWAAAQVPATELAGSLALLVVTLIGVTWVAGRIYRVGILMYGKRPSPRELLRWVRVG